VRILADGCHQPGRYLVNVKREQLPAGIYIYRMQANGTTVARRMVIAD
jgi:hypothetical protein